MMRQCVAACAAILTFGGVAMASPGGAETIPNLGTREGALPIDFVNGTVFSEMWAFSANNAGQTHGPVNAASPGVTGMPDVTGTAFIEDVQVTVAVSSPNAMERQVDITWETTSGLPFIAPGTTLGGESVSFLSFALGMDTFGAFPGAPINPFEDVQFQNVISSTGTLFDDLGNVSVSNAAGAQLFTADYAGGWGGRVFFFERDGFGDPNPFGDITQFNWQRFEATVTYKIPAPGAAGLLAVGGLFAARRRR